MIRAFVLLIFVLTVFDSDGQFAIDGHVYGNGLAVPYATVVVLDYSTGALADSLGHFNIKLAQKGVYTLQVSALGYRTQVMSITLQEQLAFVRVELIPQDVELSETQVVSSMARIATYSGPLKVEAITQAYLKSIPLNNLSETLDFINGVQQVVSCGVCATSDIHINGLEGAYTLLLMDGMPVVSALGSVYGLSGIPNQMIERLEISKGPSAIQYGTEAMGGVINVVTKKPTPGFNEVHVESAYSSHHQRMINLAINSALSRRSTLLLSASHSGNQVRYDFNGDGFTDIPTISRWSVFGKYALEWSKSVSLKSSLRLLSEERFGGQLNWKPQDKGADNIYGEWIQTQRAEWLNSLILSKDLELQTSVVGHLQDSYYGLVHLDAGQYNGFSHLSYKRIVGKNKLQAGLNHRWQHYRDNSVVKSEPYSQIVGAYLQDHIHLGSKLETMLALRVDKHNHHGFVFSPQLSTLYNLSTYSALRFNAGRGFRVVNLFTEDHAALSGSRQVVLANELKPEQSYNFTLDWSHTYGLQNWGYGRFTVDVFYNHFTNRILADYTVDPSLIVYDNSRGTSIAQGVSASVQHSIRSWCHINLGWTMLQSFQRNNSYAQRESQLLTPDHLGTLVWSILPVKRMECSLSARFVGRMHLPQYEAPFERSAVSQKFAMLNMQVKWQLKPNVDVTLAVRNLTNFTQESPLIDPGNPFGPNFDTAYVYGPLQVRNVQVSVNWSFKKNANRQSTSD